MKAQWERDAEELVARMSERPASEPEFNLLEATQRARAEIVEILARLEKGSGRTVESLELVERRIDMVSGWGPMVVARSVLLTLSPLPAENWSGS